MQLVVGRIARAHGIGGEVAVEVRTDSPDLRFAPGAVLATDPSENGPLTVERARWHSGRLLVSFAEVADRTSAEALRNTFLVADSATSPAVDEDEYWDHELIDLAVITVDGEDLGSITDVVHPPGGDLLVVRRPDGAELLVPFVRAIVPTVDIAQRRVVVDPPEGLLDL
ncbi:MAG TPA: ribosome maturation factor RimM [Mycobacteriales bacterium]|nr:ribosome maturation factor RimM [Mycobacteriales bacterium]